MQDFLPNFKNSVLVSPFDRVWGNPNVLDFWYSDGLGPRQRRTEAWNLESHDDGQGHGTWQETARWVKFEEDLEAGGDRWSKPHVGTIAMHAIKEIEVQVQADKGSVILDLETHSIQVKFQIILCWFDVDFMLILCWFYIDSMLTIPNLEKDLIAKFIALIKKHGDETDEALEHVSNQLKALDQFLISIK